MESILYDYIIQLGGKRKKLKRSTSFDLQKETNFMKAVEIYIHEHSIDIFYEPFKPEYPDSIVPAEVKLRNVNANIEEYLNNIKAVRKMYQNIYDRFKNIIPHVDSLIYRYYIFGYLIGHISLSVSPRIKKEWE
jgi:predicted transcriptional regulator